MKKGHAVTGRIFGAFHAGAALKIRPAYVLSYSLPLAVLQQGFFRGQPLLHPVEGGAVFVEGGRRADTA